jgi:hypothetical protein
VEGVEGARQRRRRTTQDSRHGGWPVGLGRRGRRSTDRDRSAEVRHVDAGA